MSKRKKKQVQSRKSKNIKSIEKKSIETKEIQISEKKEKTEELDESNNNPVCEENVRNDHRLTKYILPGLNLIIFPWYMFSKKIQPAEDIYERLIDVIISLLLILSGTFIWVGGVEYFFRIALKKGFEIRVLGISLLIMIIGSYFIRASISYIGENDYERKSKFTDKFLALLAIIITVVNYFLSSQK